MTMIKHAWLKSSKGGGIMRRVKVTVVGAGNVGGSIAQRLAEKNWYDIVLVDIVDGMPQGKALDLVEAGPVCAYDSAVAGANNYEATEESDLVIITSGIPRRPGMSRDELLETNTKIVSSVVRETAKRSPEAILIIVSNPLDVMTHVAHRVSGFPKTGSWDGRGVGFSTVPFLHCGGVTGLGGKYSCDGTGGTW